MKLEKKVRSKLAEQGYDEAHLDALMPVIGKTVRATLEVVNEMLRAKD